MSVAPRSTSPRGELTPIATLLLVCAALPAYENGPPPAHSGAADEPDCSACHFDNEIDASRGNVTLGGLPAHYSRGERYAISIALEHDSPFTGGFQLAIRNADGDAPGTIDTMHGDVQSLHSDGAAYAQHSQTRTNPRNDFNVQWTITWIAPDNARDVIFAVAAVASNDDASALGDHVYTSKVSITAKKKSSNAEK